MLHRWLRCGTRNQGHVQRPALIPAREATESVPRSALRVHPWRGERLGRRPIWRRVLDARQLGASPARREDGTGAEVQEHRVTPSDWQNSLHSGPMRGLQCGDSDLTERKSTPSSPKQRATATARIAGQFPTRPLQWLCAAEPSGGMDRQTCAVNCIRRSSC